MILILLFRCCINILINALIEEDIITCFLTFDAFVAIICYMYSFIFFTSYPVFSLLRAVIQCLLFRLRLTTL